MARLTEIHRQQKDGVQQSEELTLMAHEKLLSYFFNLAGWFDLMLRELWD
jgi:hypothetical protein